MPTASAVDDAAREDEDTAPGKAANRSNARAGWLRWIWRTLTAMRTAVVLLILLAVAAIPGSVLPQRGVSSDPGAVLAFQQDHPRLAPWLDRVGLFEVYSAPWFAAVYLLLLVSMFGCVIPRCWRLARSLRADPAPAPRNLARFPDYEVVETRQPPELVLRTLAGQLRARRFRVAERAGEIHAERGYLREVGNLIFHLSLLVLLLGIALGKLFGFEGRVAVVEGAGFANLVSEYDEFTPSALTDLSRLEPFSFTLDDFEVRFETDGPTRGQPRKFEAEVSFTRGQDSTTASATVSPNHPLNVNETKVFLTGQGYAPEVTVRDGRGDVVFSGPVIFLPIDASYASDGVIKAPDAKPEQLGFEGLFLPTAAMDPVTGPYSAFPDAVRPRLLVTAFTGDLGLAGGDPQSVFTLDKSDLQQVKVDGTPLARALAIGETMRLPANRGSITFDGVSRFANFQIAYDPGKQVSLVAAVLLLMGLTVSLFVRRRRVWVRVAPAVAGATTRVEIAALPLTRRGVPPGELIDLSAAVAAAQSPDRDPRSS